MATRTRGRKKAERQPKIVTDPVEAAQAAGLRYVQDGSPGITRQRAGKGFRYLNADGRVVRDRETLNRIKALVIPPAWSEVWICSSANGHLQATGRDAKNRKQSRYHTRWREVRDESKYGRMLEFGEMLPQIRQRVESDMAKSGLPREKVLATVVRLLETTFIRIGNAEYARTNKSFGLTTMRDRHVDVSGSTLRFQFRGKSGVQHAVDVSDRRLATIVKRCQDIPGYELFQYVDDDGEARTIDSADVNDYLREISGKDFTAKDFRTWAGTTLAAKTLLETADFETATGMKNNVAQAIKHVSGRLGNTPSVCRKCYVHPAVLEAYEEQKLRQAARRCAKNNSRQSPHGLDVEECTLLSLLRQQA